MTEKRFKDIGGHIKNMGYDKNVKFGNYTTIFTTEYGDVLITDYHIKFPNNPNCYYANKKSIEDAACFVVQHYARLSWPSTTPIYLNIPKASVTFLTSASNIETNLRWYVETYVIYLERKLKNYNYPSCNASWTN